MPMAQPQCVINYHNILGEGPHWDAEQGALIWVDIVSRTVWSWRVGDRSVQSWTLPDLVSAAVPAAGGGLAVALGRGIARLNEDGSLGPVMEVDPIAYNRTNEARCDSAGRFFVGTMQNNVGPDGKGLPVTHSTGAIFRVDLDGRVSRLVHGIGITNTLAWSPDGRTLYSADSLVNRIDAYDFDPVSGDVSGRRTFVEGGPGVPDGSAVDSEGCLWNARWGAGLIIRYAPDGSIIEKVRAPAAQPTSCVFGGPDLRTLYITSARMGLETPTEEDGAVFAMEIGVRGLPSHAYAGSTP